MAMRLRVSGMTLMACMIFIVAILPDELSLVKNAVYGAIFIMASLSTLLAVRRKGFRLRGRGELDVYLLGVCAAVLGIGVLNCLLHGVSPNALEKLLQLMICYTVLYAASQHPWRAQEWSVVLGMARGMLLLFLASWVASGFSTHAFSALMKHSNGIGAVMFSYLALYLLRARRLRLRDWGTIAAALVLLVCSTSRSNWLATAVFFSCWALFTALRKRGCKWLFPAVVAAAYLTPVGYLTLFRSAWASGINQLSLLYFGKNFFSGRQNIWGEILALCARQPLMGYGFDASPVTMLGVDLSSHHWYLQMLLQMGVVGSAAVIGSLWYLWQIFHRSRRYRVSRVAAAYLLGVLVGQCFEVSLTQNNFHTGLLTWFILGAALGQIREQRQMEGVTRDDDENA